MDISIKFLKIFRFFFDLRKKVFRITIYYFPTNDSVTDLTRSIKKFSTTSEISFWTMKSVSASFRKFCFSSSTEPSSSFSAVAYPLSNSAIRCSSVSKNF